MANKKHLNRLRQGPKQWNTWVQSRRAKNPEWQANLAGAALTGANLRGADLRKAVLTAAALRGADLIGADLTEADLTNADLVGATLRGAYLIEANLRKADLRKADLIGANLTIADLAGADLTEANLDGAGLHGAGLRGADLTRANLGSADLTIADLTGANLTKADLRRANLQGTKVDLTEDLIGAGLPEGDGPGRRPGVIRVFGSRTKGRSEKKRNRKKRDREEVVFVRSFPAEGTRRSGWALHVTFGVDLGPLERPDVLVGLVAAVGALAEVAATVGPRVDPPGEGPGRGGPATLTRTSTDGPPGAAVRMVRLDYHNPFLAELLEPLLHWAPHIIGAGTTGGVLLYRDLCKGPDKSVVLSILPLLLLPAARREWLLEQPLRIQERNAKHKMEIAEAKVRERAANEVLFNSEPLNSLAELGQRLSDNGVAAANAAVIEPYAEKLEPLLTSPVQVNAWVAPY